jgi:hypothetical protein
MDLKPRTDRRIPDRTIWDRIGVYAAELSLQPNRQGKAHVTLWCIKRSYDCSLFHRYIEIIQVQCQTRILGWFKLTRTISEHWWSNAVVILSFTIFVCSLMDFRIFLAEEASRSKRIFPVLLPQHSFFTSFIDRHHRYHHSVLLQYSLRHKETRWTGSTSSQVQ